jgi:hypothetical protein
MPSTVFSKVIIIYYPHKHSSLVFRSEGGLLHLPHHTGLHLEEIVLAVFEEAVFEVVAPGGGALEEVEHLPDHAELHI